MRAQLETCTLLKWCFGSHSLKQACCYKTQFGWLVKPICYHVNSFGKTYSSRLFREKHTLFIPIIQEKTVLFLKTSDKNIPKNVYEPWILNYCGLCRYVKAIKPKKIVGQSLFKNHLNFKILKKFFTVTWPNAGTVIKSFQKIYLHKNYCKKENYGTR